MKHIILTLLFYLTVSFTVRSQEKVTTNSISIFTDGNSYIEKTINLNPVNNKYILNDNLVPRARFGTLSITDSESSIKSIKTFIDTVDTSKILNPDKRKMASHLDMLKANLNNTVTLKTETETITGKIVETMGNNNYLTHLMIENSGRYTVTAITSIESLSFDSEINIPTGYEIDETDYHRQIERSNIKLLLLLEFNNSLPKEVSMRYLQKGLLWNPYYILELNEEKNEGSLQLKAEILNDGEAFENTDINLYVGKPNFQYADYLTDFVDYINLMDPNYDKQHTTNRREPIVIGYGNESRNSYEVKDDEKAFHDFYIYKLKNESLRSRSRGLYNLYQNNLKFEHVYVCSIGGDDANRNNRDYNGTEQVFHCLKFNNNMDRLLGAGPVTVIDKTQNSFSPIAQSRLEYTPSNADCYIKLTETSDVQVYQYNQSRLENKELVTINNSNYEKSRKTLITKIANYKNEEITLIIKQEIEGEIREDDLLKVIKSRDYLHLPNSKNTVEWQISLKPNEKKEIKYDYYYYSFKNRNY